MLTTKFPRYMVSNSAGHGFQVWDRHERRVVRSYKTLRAAMNETQRRNRKAAGEDA